MKVTIADIAAKVGVNVGTVSRVLNNRGYISDELRKKVQSAMRELDYRPNELARSLSKRKSNVIGVIVPTVAHPLFGELCEHIENYAHQNKYRILLCNSQHEKEKELEYLELLRANQVDGIILGSQTEDVAEFTRVGLPLVTIERTINETIPYVSSDNYQGGRLATEHLLGRGCRKLAMITANLGLPMLANERFAAFKDTARRHGIGYTHIDIDVRRFDAVSNDVAIRRHLVEHPEIDGIFASSDRIAARTINICHQLGWAIPEKVRIIGFGGMYIGELTSPALTSIRQPVKDMGRLAMDNLIRQIEKDTFSTRNILPVALVERDSA